MTFSAYSLLLRLRIFLIFSFLPADDDDPALRKTCAALQLHHNLNIAHGLGTKNHARRNVGRFIRIHPDGR